LSDEKKYKNYTAGDIEKYHKGLLSPKEMNELEKAALDDPFLADALEGYAAPVNIPSDLSELRNKLDERVSNKKVISILSTGSSFKWWKVAAAVIVLGGLGYFIFQISTGIKNSEVATLEKKQNQPQAPGNGSNKIQNSTPDSQSSLSSGQFVIPEKEIVTTNTNKVKRTSGKFIDSGTIKTADVNAEIASRIQPVQNHNDQKDSPGAQPLSGVAAPVAVQRRPVTAEDNRESDSFKKEARSNSRQENYFKGQIKDANNNPLPFANITNSKDNVGTYADAQGKFTLVSPDSVLDVQVRSVGFENSRVQLKNHVATNDVVMQESKRVADKVLSRQKPDTSRSRMANIKFEELEPADGWSNYNTYLANNINVPADVTSKEPAERHVQVSFDVNQQGNPVNIRVEKSLCNKCDEEAVRVIEQGPKWKRKSKEAKRITITVPFDMEH